MTAAASATALMLAEFARLLPQTSTLPAPAFLSLAECRSWLAAQAITNTRQTQIRLTEQLQRLNALNTSGTRELDDKQREAIIDSLRSPIHFVQNERSKVYQTERPALPLPAQELVELQKTLTLWQTLIDAYSLALRKRLERSIAQPFDPELAAEVAQLATLALITARFSLLTSLRAGLRPSADFWRQADGIYFIAEHLQATSLPVADKLTHTAAATVSAHYVGLQLLAASEPHSLSLRELQFTHRWIRRWTNKVPLLNSLPATSATTPWCIKLASGQPAQPQVTAPRKLETATWRWLDMHGLRKTLKQRLQGLRDGRSPEELKLGKGLNADECKTLLQILYARWCKAQSMERFQPPHRAHETHEYQLVAGLTSIHQILGGRTPASASAYLRPGAYDRLATFGHLQPPSQLHSPTVIAAENWRGHSLNLKTLQLQRATAEGARLYAGQLIALKENPTADWQLARLLWLRIDLETSDGPVLQALAESLPGRPSPVTIYLAEATRPQPLIGLQLPAVPQLNQAASLLLPPGHYRPQLKLEIRQPQTQTLQLTRLLARGQDHEWCEALGVRR